MQDSAPKVKDNCPVWAAELFIRIQALEIRLGNVRETAAKMRSLDLDELVKRAEADDSIDHADNEMVEALFDRTCRGLFDEGFDAGEIAAFANARIGAGGGLPYCNAEEVSDTLQK